MEVVLLFSHVPLMAVVSVLVVVVHVMPPMRMGPRFEGRQANDAVSYLTNQPIDPFLVRNRRMTRVVSDAPHAPLEIG